MTGFATYLAEDRRRLILTYISEAGGSCNDAVLLRALRAMGHLRGCTRDSLIEDLDWLRARGLVRHHWAGPLLAARLTERGADVAAGAAEIDGVRALGWTGRG